MSHQELVAVPRYREAEAAAARPGVFEHPDTLHLAGACRAENAIAALMTSLFGYLSKPITLETSVAEVEGYFRR